MSIPYEAMHAAAAPYKPDGTIKETTTWIAIMLHSITSLKQIKDRNDFLWLKCHSKITLKTLKHEYFTRHPLEEFELKFDRKFPPEDMQVGYLAKQNPVKDSEVVVLRAFEESHIEDEEEIEEDLRVAAGLHEKYNGRGATAQDAIDLDDNTSSDEADTPASTPSKKRKLEVLAEPYDQQAVNGDSADSDMATLEADGEGDGDNEGEEEPEITYLPSWDWTPFLSRLHDLPENYKANINASPWSHCETCGKYMLTKPWTLFGLGYGTLCTSCSMLQLADAADEKGVTMLKELCAEELAEKHDRAMIGPAQNMDADAPLDWARELGNIHETVGQDQAEIQYEPSDELLDEEDAANAQLHAELELTMPNAARSSKERLNHFERDQQAGDCMTNGIQSYKTATTIKVSRTPPTSALELIDNGDMDTSADEDKTHMAVERNILARAESPILGGDMEVEGIATLPAAGDQVDDASEKSFETAEEEIELKESASGSGGTVMRDGEPDRREVVDQWLARAYKEGSDSEYHGEDEEEDE